MTAGRVLRSDGTNFVSAQLAASDLSNGVTGSGAAVLATSPTVSAPTISSPTLTGDSLYKRLKATQGSPLVVGDVGSLTASWGSTASVQSVTGTDAGGSITVLSSGTGQAANPTFILTFHDGTWTNSPIVVCCRADFFAPVAAFIHSGASATNVGFGFNGTPVAGSAYTVHFIAIGR